MKLKVVHWKVVSKFGNNQSNIISDPRTVDLILMNPPWVPFAMVGAYLYFVLSLGPKLMANRKPFDLRRMLLVYNLLQVAVNIYVAYTVRTL